MISVLLVEDIPEKADQIRAVLLEDGYCNADQIRCEDSEAGAKLALREQHFDLLLLDVSLPRSSGELPDPHGGIRLLGEIESRPIYKKPTHIVGITGHSSLLEAAGKDFLAFAWPMLFYDRSSDLWRTALRQRLRRLETDKAGHGGFKSDLAIVTALYETELDAVKDNGWMWDVARIRGDHSNYLHAKFHGGNSPRNAYATAAARMGIAEASVIASKVISTFSPRFLAMTGVMGGVRDRVSLGDIVIAEPCWDYGSGKWVRSGNADVFEPAPYQMALSPFLRECFRKIAKDWDFLKFLHESFEGYKPANPPSLLLGPVGTGASVVANERLVKGIVAQNRKLLGIEMEAYGVLAAATEAATPRPDAFVVKSVSDFADSTKADDVQAYCAWVSAMTVKHLAENYLFEL